MGAPLRTPETTKARVAAPASSDALVSTLTLATVPQDIEDHDTEFDHGLFLLAALSVADDVRVLAISRNLRADDLGSADATIFAVMLDLARAGTAPTLQLVHGRLSRDGLFGGHKGPQLKSRMLDIATTSASPLQLDDIALAIVDATFRRAALAMGEGIYNAADKYAVHALMPYVRQLGTQLNSIDQRRMALGGESE